LDYAEIHFLPVRRFKGPFFMDVPDAMKLFWTTHVECAAWFCADKECVVSIVLDACFNVKAFHLTVEDGPKVMYGRAKLVTVRAAVVFAKIHRSRSIISTKRPKDVR
jgi:hypothetical protein